MTLQLTDTQDHIDREKNVMYVHLHPYENITISESDWGHFLYVYDATQKYEVDWECFHDPSHVLRRVCFDVTMQRNIDRWEIPLRLKQ